MCGNAETLFVVGLLVELLGLVVLIVDTVLRMKRADTAIGEAATRIHVNPGRMTMTGSDVEVSTGDDDAGPTTWNDIHNVRRSLQGMARSTQADMTALDERLRQLVDARFDAALAHAERQADEIRAELQRDARRTAWRPLVSTVLLIAGLAMSGAANLCTL